MLQSQGDHPWPLIAADETDLLRQLAAGGHILPLPKEPAALANILEVSVVRFLEARVNALPGASMRIGTERGYPDFELSGPAFNGSYHAVDIKAARRAVNAKGQATNRTKSPITLYTGNTYFRHPTERFPGVLRPFDDYASHLDVLCVYTLDDSAPERMRDLEFIVQEPWRIASKRRSSSTREYIGAIQDIDGLRNGRGSFENPEEFYRFWRKYKFKTARIAEQVLSKK